jgi:DNA (cytosine-5)-methyltransferase 1
MKINTFFDFCSGIGAGRLGLEQSGLRCVGYSDTSRLSVATYKTMFWYWKWKELWKLKKN